MEIVKSQKQPKKSISRVDPLSDVISIDPQRLGGTPCFAGTRVPIQSLFEHLEAGDGLEIFLEDFEGVSHKQAVAVLQLASKNLLLGLSE